MAVTSRTRSSALPDVPTLAEADLPGQETETIQGVLVPARTPQPIIDYLHREITGIVATTEVREAFNSIGFEPVGRQTSSGNECRPAPCSISLLDAFWRARAIIATVPHRARASGAWRSARATDDRLVWKGERVHQTAWLSAIIIEKLRELARRRSRVCSA